MRIKLLAPIFVLVVFAVTACGAGDDPTMGTPEADMPMSDGHEATKPPAEGARQIEVTAAVGEDVAIVLTASDVEHDFVIDEFDAHVVADAGETATGGFTAAAAGRFTYYCSVPGHRDAGMTGALVVE